jgi:hypothetical protein
LLNFSVAPTLNTNFLPLNLNWSAANYAAASLPGSPNIPHDFFSGSAARNFLTWAYPYNQAEAVAWTEYGLPWLFQAAGPIVPGMGDFFPTNVTFPTPGNPNTNPSSVGGAAWWWAQGTNPSSPYYDAELAACTPGTPCVFPIVGQSGNPGLDTSISEWITSVESISSNAVQPYTFDLNGDGCGGIGSLLWTYCQPNSSPGNGPLPVWNLGWVADNFDPSDYMIPMAYPNSTFTFSDAVAEQFAAPDYDNVGLCGHATVSSYSNLIYWAHQTQLTSGCQGVAYQVADYWNHVATHVVDLAQRTLDYNLVMHVLNALSLYVWYGQANQITAYAPWIAGASVNNNPVVGGFASPGGLDQYWFQIRTVASEVPVTFKETGLDPGRSWSVDVIGSGSKGETVISGPTNSVEFPRTPGTIRFSISPPAGYGVAKITGPDHPTFSDAIISGATTLTVKFGQLEPVNFNELIHAPSWPGLPVGTTFGVTLTPTTLAGAPGGSATTVTTITGGTVSFTEPKGASFKFTVSKPSIYTDAGGKGGFSVGASGYTHSVKFKLDASSLTFSESGLAAHTSWSVTVNQLTPVSGTTTLTSSTASIKFALTNGTYSYTIPSVGAFNPTPASGSISVTAAPHGLPTIHVHFADPPGHAALGTGVVMRGTSTIMGRACAMAARPSRAAS